MGGGAGIRFKIGDFAESTVEAQVSELASLPPPPAIAWFDAEGYMDGMDKVDGRLLTPVAVEVDVSEMTDVEEGTERGCVVYLYFNTNYSKFEEMIFGGWVRGEVTEGMQISFTGDIEYELHCEGQTVGTYSAPATITYALTEEGVYWYEDVFGSPDVPEDEWDYWNEDLRANYGYGGR
jgi:hypothetical protein